MKVILFNAIPCWECGRIAEEFSRCPWCGANVRASALTYFRTAVFLLIFLSGIISHFLPEKLNAGLPLYFIIALAGAVFSTGFYLEKKHDQFFLAVSAVAVSGLCHIFPKFIVYAKYLRFHLSWLTACVALVLMALNTSAPPIPPSSLSERIIVKLKNIAGILFCTAPLVILLIAPINILSFCATVLWCIAAIPLGPLPVLTILFAATASYGANALIAFAFGITMASAIQCAAGGTN